MKIPIFQFREDKRETCAADRTQKFAVGHTNFDMVVKYRNVEQALGCTI